MGVHVRRNMQRPEDRGKLPIPRGRGRGPPPNPVGVRIIRPLNPELAATETAVRPLTSGPMSISRILSCLYQVLSQSRIIEGENIAGCSVNTGMSCVLLTAEFRGLLTNAGGTGPFSKLGPRQSLLWASESRERLPALQGLRLV